MGRKQLQAEITEFSRPENLSKARGFVRTTAPLTPKGKEFQKKLEKAYASKDLQTFETLCAQIPTVEHPGDLSFYRDITLSEANATRIFGNELANVQITKGCSHGCDFCAAGAERKIDMMPFSTVIQIAQKMRENPKMQQLRKSLNDLITELERQNGS